MGGQGYPCVFAAIRYDDLAGPRDLDDGQSTDSGCLEPHRRSLIRSWGKKQLWTRLGRRLVIGKVELPHLHW